MKLLKRISEIYDNEYDLRSQELFDKNYSQLDPEEVMIVGEYMNDLLNPEWAPIFINDEISGYEISNVGTIMNSSGKILSPYMINSGYKSIKISYHGNRYALLIHRLVAEYFIFINRDLSLQVNHINGKKTINWYRNLEWNTRVENMQHAAKNDLLKPRYGASSPYAIHTNEQIEEVCKLLESRKYSYKEIINKTKVHYKTLMGIIGGKKWQFIAKKYDIPKPKVSFWNEQRQHDVDDLIMKGYTTRDIIKILNYPDNNASNIWIQRRIKKVKPSTTIPLG